MNKNIKLVKILSLIIAILGAVLAIPMLGSIVDFYGIFTITEIVLAIVILSTARGLELKKSASVLSIVGGIIGLIGITISKLSTSVVTDAIVAGATIDEALALTGVMGIFTSIFAFPSWIMLILSTVFHFMNFSKLTKMETEEFIDIPSMTDSSIEVVNVVVEEPATITTDNNSTEV